MMTKNIYKEEMSVIQMKSGLSFVVILLVFALNFSSALLVTDFNATDTYSSYAPPNDAFSGSSNKIFTLGDDQHTISSSDTVANVGIVEVDETGAFIWKTGYYRNFSSNSWIPFNFSGNVIKNSAGQNTNWLSETATATLSIKNSSLRSGSNPILAYSCKKYNDVWKCGCLSNGESGNCKRWMLQLINVSGEVQQTHGGSGNVCGDGIVNQLSEACDNSDLNSQTCAAVMGTGYAGSLSCSSTCTLVTTSCVAPILITGCRDLNETGKTYVLQNDILNHVGTCFNVKANNIVLNINGKKVNGDSIIGNDYGIYSDGYNNLIITAGDISGFGAGIRILNSNNHSIFNISVNHPTYVANVIYGILLNGVSNSSVLNINITSLKSDQVYSLGLYSSNNNIFSGNVYGEYGQFDYAIMCPGSSNNNKILLNITGNARISPLTCFL